MRLQTVCELRLHFLKTRDIWLDALLDRPLEGGQTSEEEELVEAVHSFEEMQAHPLFKLMDGQFSEY